MTTTPERPVHAPSPEKTLLSGVPAIRCSTAERERTGARLHRAAGEGRLDLDETGERLGRAWAARYRHELEALILLLVALLHGIGAEAPEFGDGLR